MAGLLAVIGIVVILFMMPDNDYTIIGRVAAWLLREGLRSHRTDGVGQWASGS